ncbi:hypothetical protein PG990_011481 [Apiospora arundinis]
MAVSTRSAANNFVAAGRRLYNPLGLSYGYNFVLWCVLAGSGSASSCHGCSSSTFTACTAAPMPHRGKGRSPASAGTLSDWFYGGSILTMRLVMVLAAVVISKKSGYYAAMSCGKIHFIIKEQNTTAQRYPECTTYFGGTNPDQHAVIPAHISGQDEVQAAAVLALVAGGAFWLALFLHAFGIEIYVGAAGSFISGLRLIRCSPNMSVYEMFLTNAK